MNSRWIGHHASPKATAAFIAQAIDYKGSDCLLWPFAKSSGYGRVAKGYVHRLVCEAAHGAPSPERYEAAHSCGIRACVNPAHLRWDTPKGNQADQIEHCGGQYANARLTVAQARAVLAQPARSNRNLAREYGVTVGTIKHIRHKRNWSWL